MEDCEPDLGPGCADACSLCRNDEESLSEGVRRGAHPLGPGKDNHSQRRQSDRRPRNPQSQPDYVVDPLTFSVVKALLSFVVYGQKVTFGGWLNPQSINRIDGAIYGGWKGILVGTAITGLFSIYDAVLKK